MSITLNDLLEWRDRLPEPSGEEAQMVGALITRREAELRIRIADLIASVSQRENWKLQRCAAIARRAEQAPIHYLESIHKFFQDRDEGTHRFETPLFFPTSSRKIDRSRRCLVRLCRSLSWPLAELARPPRSSTCTA